MFYILLTMLSNITLQKVAVLAKSKVVTKKGGEGSIFIKQKHNK